MTTQSNTEVPVPEVVSVWSEHRKATVKFVAVVTIVFVMLAQFVEFRTGSFFDMATEQAKKVTNRTNTLSLTDLNKKGTRMAKGQAKNVTNRTNTLPLTELNKNIIANGTRVAKGHAKNVTERTNTLPLTELNKNIIVNGRSISLLEDTNITGLPLPRPIMVVGLPKAGTSSIRDFFKKAGYTSVHWSFLKREGNSDQRVFVGVCIKEAIRKNESFIDKCGPYDVWAQMDVQENRKQCVFPQITYLNEIHRAAPNATFILNRRDLDKWGSSMERWHGGANRRRIADRVVECPNGPLSAKVTDLINWYLGQIQRIRQFVQQHPSHALIEIDIADSDTAVRMGKAFQLPSEYWGHSNHNTANPIKVRQ